MKGRWPREWSTVETEGDVVSAKKPGAPEEPIVLTVQQAAKLLQVSANHVYSLVSQGAIPHTRFGKLIRIPRWGLLQFIAASSGAPVPAFLEVDSQANQSVHALELVSEEDSNGER